MLFVWDRLIQMGGANGRSWIVLGRITLTSSILSVRVVDMALRSTGVRRNGDDTKIDTKINSSGCNYICPLSADGDQFAAGQFSAKSAIQLVFGIPTIGGAVGELIVR